MLFLSPRHLQCITLIHRKQVALVSPISVFPRWPWSWASLESSSPGSSAQHSKPDSGLTSDCRDEESVSCCLQQGKEKGGWGNKKQEHGRFLVREVVRKCGQDLAHKRSLHLFWPPKHDLIVEKGTLLQKLSHKSPYTLPWVCFVTNNF